LTSLTELDLMGFDLPHSNWQDFWRDMPQLRYLRTSYSKAIQVDFKALKETYPNRELVLTLVDQETERRKSQHRNEARPPAETIEWKR